MPSSTVDICILIPCYNNIQGLVQTLNSISYDKGKFRVLVVDDGSPEKLSSRLPASFPSMMPVDIIRLPENQGITRALNAGLEYISATISTRYIARLDCGDICHSQRFYLQVQYLDAHPAISLLGTWCYFKNRLSGEGYSYTTPLQHDSIRKSMHFRNVFIHPTVMWRVERLNGCRYPEIYPYAEDYGLFYNMISSTESAILDQFLVTCEINPRGISLQNRKAQLKSRIKVITSYGTNTLLVTLGAIKLYILLTIPYPFIQMLKMRLYKT
jgi:glycosyltransferase involved in cell wall biosynthesis